MKNLLAALAVAGALTSPAFAGPCVALDYQEMKDMPADELVMEACKARASISENLDDGIADLGARPGRQANPTSHDNFEQCMGQSDRIERVLAAKGVSKESIATTCETKNAEAKARLDQIMRKGR